MRCPNCGNENPDDYTFCDECGAKLTADTGDGAVAAPTDVDGAAAPSPMPAPAAPSGGEAAPAEMAGAVRSLFYNCR